MPEETSINTQAETTDNAASVAETPISSPETAVQDVSDASETVESSGVAESTESASAAAPQAPQVARYLSDAMRHAGWSDAEIAERVKEVGVERASAEFDVFAEHLTTDRRAPREEPKAPEFTIKPPDLSADLAAIKQDYPELVPVFDAIVGKITASVADQMKGVVGQQSQFQQQREMERAQQAELQAVHQWLDTKSSQGYGDFLGTSAKMSKFNAQARAMVYQTAIALKQAAPSMEPTEALEIATIRAARRLSGRTTQETQKRDEQVKSRSAQRTIAPTAGGRGGQQESEGSWEEAAKAVTSLLRRKE